jgi:hypothetical protein
MMRIKCLTLPNLLPDRPGNDYDESERMLTLIVVLFPSLLSDWRSEPICRGLFGVCKRRSSRRRQKGIIPKSNFTKLLELVTALSSPGRALAVENVVKTVDF